MSLFKNYPVLTAFPIINLLFCSDLFAANIYADNTLSENCSGNYSVEARRCSGSDGKAFRTIQAAINGSAVGDVIYMRDGTYREISIDIPESKNGTAWTEGNFTTLRSYPGEWAKIDATGLTATGGLNSGVIVHAEGFGTGSDSQYTEYWKLSNFEVTGGGAGISIKCRHVKMHYLYIHDNGRAGVSNLQSGITTVNPQYLEVKYSYFKDNVNAAEPNRNNAHILLDGDYRDGTSNGGEGESWIERASTHHNEIAYNYFELTGSNFNGDHIGFRHKNQQRFGTNGRDPNDPDFRALGDYGDKFHHNIVVGSRESIATGQDFVQVYNNITDSVINIGRSGDLPVTYHHVVYNNTVRVDPIMDQSAGITGYISFSGTGGNEVPPITNHYDNLPQRTVHEHAWFYNNISDDTGSNFNDVPFRFHRDMPSNATNMDTDNVDLVVENNFIHNNANPIDISIGNKGSGVCAQTGMQVSDFNTCSETWRGVDAGTVRNWKNKSAGLYIGDTGAAQYITNHAFKLDDTKTICTGGRSGNHPYLIGVRLPGYVGATNPNDYAWVSGVFVDVRSTNWLMAQNEENPSWIEKAESQPGVCKAPPKPPKPGA